MADRKFGFETRCLHAGVMPDAATGARAEPICCQREHTQQPSLALTPSKKSTKDSVCALTPGRK